MKSYLIRPSVRKILYVLILSLGTFILSRKYSDLIYQVLAAFSLVSALYVILQRLFPRSLKLSDTELIVPLFTPYRVMRLSLNEIEEDTVKKKNNRWMMTIKLKNGKKHSFDVDDVERWEEFYQEFEKKRPA